VNDEVQCVNDEVRRVNDEVRCANDEVRCVLDAVPGALDAALGALDAVLGALDAVGRVFAEPCRRRSRCAGPLSFYMGGPRCRFLPLRRSEIPAGDTTCPTAPGVAEHPVRLLPPGARCMAFFERDTPFDDYVIVRPLAAGRVAEVYEVRDRHGCR